MKEQETLPAVEVLKGKGLGCGQPLFHADTTHVALQSDSYHGVYQMRTRGVTMDYDLEV